MRPDWQALYQRSYIPALILLYERKTGSLPLLAPFLDSHIMPLYHCCCVCYTSPLHTHTLTSHPPLTQTHRHATSREFLGTDLSLPQELCSALPREKFAHGDGLSRSLQLPCRQLLASPNRMASGLAGRKRAALCLLLSLSPCCNLLNPSGAPLSHFLEMPHFKDPPVRKGQRVHEGLSC